MRALLLAAGIVALATGCDDAANRTTQPDNTAVNERDANGSMKTPLDQSNEETDIDQVAKIRADVLEIDDLSVAGRNVKIITDGGRVTLRGPVASAAERDAIANVAANVVGEGNVDNQLEIEPE
ncbi:BON domain protein [Botrimarina colliarenosi]|uniref:BON domain protein n=1 Tax=Botrimarina colliarenosi TaxID=2528001 RepID=A0A5C6AMB1_9BACT|nr:BON domain-containing protein [Botrimarina colliarenosi]TWU00607.1 BON domain protein [Botrimarina colliarenosi]